MEEYTGKEISRTQFISILSGLDCDCVRKSKFGYGFALSHDEFKKHMDATIELLKKYDEEYKNEQNSLPTLEVFVEEEINRQPKRHCTFKFELRGRKWEFNANDIVFFFGGSTIMKDYVVVAVEETETKPGWYVSEAQYGFPEYTYELVLREKDNYNNVRQKPIL